jgi:hypothetical protein
MLSDQMITNSQLGATPKGSVQLSGRFAVDGSKHNSKSMIAALHAHPESQPVICCFRVKTDPDIIAAIVGRCGQTCLPLSKGGLFLTSCNR